MYLLDTDHCISLLNGHDMIRNRLRQLQDTLLFTCVVVEGELLYGVYNSRKVEANLSCRRAFLRDIFVHPIDRLTADVYGQIKTAVLNCFGPKEKRKRRKSKSYRLGFGDNDLWIAAVAKRHGLILVSRDKHFKRMGQAVDLPVESWLE